LLGFGGIGGLEEERGIIGNLIDFEKSDRKFRILIEFQESGLDL
jgi:hypothetical protein